MNRFLQAAIQNMENVEAKDAGNVHVPQLTQEAIAYALIAIAEAMQVPQDVSGMTQGKRVLADGRTLQSNEIVMEWVTDETGKLRFETGELSPP